MYGWYNVIGRWMDLEVNLGDRFATKVLGVVLYIILDLYPLIQFSPLPPSAPPFHCSLSPGQ